MTNNKLKAIIKPIVNRIVNSNNLLNIKYRNLKNSIAFNEKFYLDTNADVRNSKVDAFEHFCKTGWKELRNPNYIFNTMEYLDGNPDVKISGMNPFFHFMEFGFKENRMCNQKLDMDYIAHYLAHNHIENENYLEVILKDSNNFAEVEIESFYKDYNYGLSVSEIDQIKQLNLFDEEYYIDWYPDVAQADIDPLDHYLYFGYKENRNPSANFDTHFYRAQYQRNIRICPLIHYIRYGKAEGHNPLPVNSICISTLETNSIYKNKIAIHLHLYYSDLINDISPLLVGLQSIADFYISTTTLKDKAYIEQELEKQGINDHAYVHLVKNVGRDLGPLFIEFSDIWAKYDYICHLHSKKSPHTNFGHRWRNYLLDQLIGSIDILSALLEYMDKNTDIGILYPENYFQIKKFAGINGNLPEMKKFLSKLSLQYDESKVSGDFPAGSMCIMRTSAYLPLINYQLSIEDFDSESGKVEGALEHSIERCLTIIPEIQGYKSVVIYGKSTNPTAWNQNWFRKDRFTKINNQSKWMRDSAEIALNHRVDLKPTYIQYNPDSLCIHWIIPDFGIGAGGHMTIFRIVRFLEEFGHRQIIWIQNCNNYLNPEHAKKTIYDSYQKIGNNVIVQFLPENVEYISGDVVIATDCWTVFPMMQMERFKERFYFIQDWEPMFHPVGDAHLIADLTYDFHLNALCAGKWLANKATERGMWSRCWYLASDRDYYYPSDNKKKNQVFNIAFYARKYTPRRAVMLGIAALKSLFNDGVDIHVKFFGEQNLAFDVDFSHEYLGILSPKELGNLYREADIGLVFSATNYSLIPLEMMACGLPVVDLDVESTRAVFDPSVIQMVSPDPLKIKEKLKYLIENPTELQRQAKQAVTYVDNLSWETTARSIESSILDKLNEKFTPLNLATLFDSGKDYTFKASIIIPAFNAGDAFEDIIKALLNQKTDFPYEIIVVDSGSTDNTLEIINKYKCKNLKLFEIANKDFQHGKTRNFAISKSKGEYITVITQDAKPLNEYWLANLVKAFEKTTNIAGVFGAHQAYEQHSNFVHRDIANVFKHYDHIGDLYSWDMNFPEFIIKGSIEWQMNLQYYSDNNACMKRSVWEQLPYPEIDWGEDQAWAWMIIQLGLKKAFAKEAIVYHSHDDSYETRFKVSKIETNYFKRCFGIKLFDENQDVEDIIKKQAEVEIAFADDNKVPQVVLDHQIKLIEATIYGRVAADKEIY